ncbi:hypothetical protein G3N55_10375 [Dissulfurirhabdus thermomarina]|uniref:Tetratricopeptide repeat protein n=2 Tax=Dissulfurirhabdus thermomarina TaxID=1765737 RepID=A0A6N9TU34_DISTH|nr:hypothetical protein [Dissulfurirhabdus thermomarina]NMX23436.1 hypothetical protein [Dissulfurirhabdus thermomarina]
MVDRATSRLAADLTEAIRNQDDPETVRQGGPAYLLLVDALIAGSPDNEELLSAGASLYGAYAGFFVDDPARARRLAGKALGYGARALCRRRAAACALRGLPFDAFRSALDGFGRGDVPALFGLATAWTGWIQANANDWNAVAELPKVQALLRRILELDEGYRAGEAHLYLGALLALRPPALGGRPEAARRHFERAIALSGGRNLMAKVLYAERYARMVFDKALHDRLLREVLAADPSAPGLTLTNTLAQERARRLLAESDAYF